MRDEWLKPSPQFDAPEFCSPSLLGPDWCWSNLSLNIYTTPIALSTSTTNERSYVESLVIEEEDDEEKKFKFKWKFLRRKTWQQQKKNKKRKNFPFQKNIFVFIFRARQKVLFSVKLSSFSPLFHCRLVGAVVTPSLVIQKMLLPPHISPVFFLYYY